MSTFTYSALANASVTSFNPLVDVLNVDGGISAASFDLQTIDAGPNTGRGMVFEQRDPVTGAVVKSISLLFSVSSDPTNPYKIASGHIAFVNGSLLLVGDNTTGTGDDSTAATLNGGAGDDQLISFGGGQILNGGDGNDRLVTVGSIVSTLIGAGTDVFNGGNGTDTLILDDVAGMTGYTVNLASGTGAVAGANASAFTLSGIENVSGSLVADTITGDGADNLLNGGGGNDVLNGGAGNDTLIGGFGNDTLDGGSGNDLVSYLGVSGAVMVKLNNGIAIGPEGADLLAGIENVQGSAFADSLTANNAANVYLGKRTDVNETLEGMGGNDTLDGGSSAVDRFAIASYAHSGAAVTVNLGTGIASDGFGGTDTLVNIDGVVGSAFNDSLTGGSSSSQIYAAFPFEQFEGGAGNDTIDGGAGVDRAVYEHATGSVTVDLALGTATGADGNDTLISIEQVRGSNFNDTLTGNSGVNNFEGMGGNDTIDGAAGYDSLRYVRSTGAVTVTFNGIGSGTASDGLGGTDTFSNIEEIQGSDLNDTLIGGAGNETFIGNAGNDSIDGGAGTADRISYSTSRNNTGVTVNLFTGTATDSWGNTDTFVNIESVLGSQFADTLTGGFAPNSYTGTRNDPSQTFEGLGGNDTINGGGNAPNELGIVTYVSSNAAVNVNLATGIAQDGWGGTDTLFNIDIVTGSNFNDVLTGGSTSSQFFDGVWFEQFEGGLGNDTIDGANGTDRASYQNASGAVTVNLATGTSSGADGNDTLISIEQIRGSNFNDTLTGDANNNAIEGLGGDDTIDGGNGFDALRFQRSTAAITITYSGAGAGTTTDGLGGTDTFIGIEQVEGSDQNDTFIGGAGNETFVGNAGNDSINGGTGIDRVSYYSSRSGVSVNLSTNSAIDSWANTDTLLNIDNIFGSYFNDTLVGDLNANLIDGSNGNDTLTGGAGNDTLIGGYGTDVAIFSGNQNLYTVTALGNKSFTVAGPDGTDTVTNVETLQFANGSQALGTGNAYTYSGLANTSVLLFDPTQDVLVIDGGLSANVFDVDPMRSGPSGGTELVLPQFDPNTGSTVKYISLLFNGTPANTNFYKITTGNISFANGSQLMLGDNTTGIGDDSTSVTLTGGSGNDLLISLGGSQTLNGGDGNDTLLTVGAGVGLTGGSGTDVFNGGNGIDRLELGPVAGMTGYTVNLATGTGSVAGANPSTFTLSGIENLGGSDANDSLTGDANNNVLAGRLGNDTLNGGSGSDTASYLGAHGSVAVSLRGGTATDADGVDTLISIEGVQGSNSADVLNGGFAPGAFLGLSGDPRQTIEGMGGNDSIDGGSNAVDEFVTASYAHSGAAVVVNLGTGIASDGFGGSDTLTNIDGVTGSAFNDSLTGGSSSAQISADNLFEQFEGGLGNDTIDGGGGFDRVIYSNASGAVTVNLTLGTATGADGNDTLISIEQVRGSNFADTLTGDTFNNAFEGMGGNDTIDGVSGYDSVRYDRSTAAVNVSFSNSVAGSGTASDGMGGTDTFSNIDDARGSDFADTLTGGIANETFVGNAGNDTIDGGAGFDRVSYVTSRNHTGVTVNLFTGTATDSWGNTDTLISIESALGSQFADTLTGGFAPNLYFGLRTDPSQTFEGLGGNDTINGGSNAPNDLTTVTYFNSIAAVNVNLGTGIASDGFGGTDTLSNIELVVGSAFNDVLTGGSTSSQFFDGGWFESFEGGLGNDTIDGANGTDRASYQNASGAVTVNLATGSSSGADGNDTLISIEQIRGSNFNDTLTGDGNNNAIEGLGGNDTIDGGAGFDTLRYQRSTAAVTVTFSGTGAGTASDGLGGTDTFTGIELVEGSDQNDTLIGGAGNDNFIGNAGNDSIDGGTGIDRVLYGSSRSGVSVNLATNSAIDSWGNTDTLLNIDNIFGSNFNDTLVGDVNANLIDGGIGNDTLTGGAGNDTLIGGYGTDVAIFSGDKSLYTVTALGNKSFTVAGPDGTDTVTNVETLQFATGGSQVLGSGNAYTYSALANTSVLLFDPTQDVLVIDGGLSATAFDFEPMRSGPSGGTELVVRQFDPNIGTGATVKYISLLFSGTPANTNFYKITTGNISFANGSQLMLGDNTTGIGDDTSSVTLTGGGGKDFLISLGGSQTLNGGDGDDTLDTNGSGLGLTGGSGTDIFNGGNGIDRLNLGSVPGMTGYTVSLATGTGSVAGSNPSTFTLSGIENLGGSQVADNLTGDLNANLIRGEEGDDTLAGGLGNDTLLGGSDGSDWVSYQGASGAVTVNLGLGTASGADGSDILIQIENILGSTAGDTLTGDNGDNVINGLTGNDTIDGGLGNDTATYVNASGGVSVNLLNNVVSGADGADSLTSIENLQGSNSGDTLTGDGNANVIEGMNGNDTLDGGVGIDVASYLNASGAVTANLATGTASGAAGSDTLANFEGITGSAFNDTLSGNGGDNTIQGMAGNDTIDGGLGNDLLDGGSGTDTVSYLTAAFGVTANLATGLATGGAGQDNLVFIENLQGSNFSDTLTGDANDNLLDGGNGNDTLTGGAGNDTLNGGAGFDFASYVGVTGAVTVNLTTNIATGAAGNDTLISIEGVNGTEFGDTFTGNSSNNSFEGWGGNDTIDGGAGFDSLRYTSALLGISATFNGIGSGTASDGRGGLDTFSNIESIQATIFNDTLTGGAGNDDFVGMAGNDTIDGGAGGDRANYFSATSAVTVNLATGTASGGDGNDTLISIERVGGSNFADILTGGNALDFTVGLRTDPFELFEGRGGNDTIDGGSNSPNLSSVLSYFSAPSAVNVNLGTGIASDGYGGTDTLFNIDYVSGSAFNDTLTGGGNSTQITATNPFEQFEGGLGDDLIDGGAGTDRANYSNATGAVTVDLGAGTATGADGNDTLISIEQVRGSAFADTLTGSSGNNAFEALAGNDTIDGGAGYDSLRYNQATGAVTVTFNGVGSGTASDGFGTTDTFSNIEEIQGSDQNDTFIGGAGNETFFGLAGNDSMNGGAGRDRVSYSNARQTGVTVNLATGTATDNWGGTDTLISIESVQGSQFADTLTGGNPDHVFQFLRTDPYESFEGMGGNDTINGGSSAPDVGAALTYAASIAAVYVNLGTGIAYDGFGGTDTLTNIDYVGGSAFSDVLIGGSGSSQVIAGNLFEQFEGGLGDDTIDGGSGTDRASYQNAGGSVTVNLATGTSSGAAGNDTLISIEQVRGSAFADTLTGDANNNALEGLAGNDTIDGGGGYDSLRYQSSTGAVTVNFTGVGSGTASDGYGNTDIFSNIEEVYGSDQNDTLTGGAGDETLVGNAGNDLLDGGAGTADRVSYISSRNVGVTVNLATGTATDSWGNTDSLINIENIQGSQFADILTGSSGVNVIEGLAGKDTLSGGAGNDTLDGGLGLDTAVFSGLRSAYTITRNPGGNEFIVSGPDGTDHVTGIETLRFADSSTVLASLASNAGIVDNFGPLRYIASYPDLIAAFGADADAGLSHFLAGGFAEGRSIGFNGLRYIASYPDLIASLGANAEAGAQNYLQTGLAQGRSASFDGLRYIASYPDLIGAFGANADAGIAHYVSGGYAEGRVASFDGLRYIASYPDLIGAIGANAAAGIAHYVSGGFTEGRSVSFNALKYIASYPDLIGAFGANTAAATAHYVAGGFAEGRTASFDGLRYLATNPDLIVALGGNADAGIAQYVNSGFAAGRTAGFDGLKYIASYADLIGAFGLNADAGIAHFVQGGFAEGRTASFNAQQYLANYADLAAAYGSNPLAAEVHFIAAGYGEGRTDLQLVFNGTSGNDTLSGNAASNTINAGLGNDTLAGGLGNDVLTGGANADSFVFNTALNGSTNRDTITDFEPGTDRLLLDDAIFTALTIGSVAPGNLVSGAAAAGSAPAALDANDVLLYNSDTGQLFYDPDGSGATPATLFVTLAGNPLIFAADFAVF